MLDTKGFRKWPAKENHRALLALILMAPLRTWLQNWFGVSNIYGVFWRQTTSISNSMFFFPSIHAIWNLGWVCPSSCETCKGLFQQNEETRTLQCIIDLLMNLQYVECGKTIFGGSVNLNMSEVFNPDLEKIGRAGPTHPKSFATYPETFMLESTRKTRPYLWKCQQWNLEYLSIDLRWKRWPGISQWLVWRHGQGTYFKRHLNLCLVGTRSTMTTRKPTGLSGKPMKSLGGHPCLFRLSQVILGETLCHTACTVTEAEVRPRDQCWSQATKCSFRREDWKQQICMGNLTALVWPQ